MANGMNSTLAVGWDGGFIFEKAAVTDHFGVTARQDGTSTIGYRVEDADAVLTAIKDYPRAYAEERQKPAMLDQIGEIRAAKILAFTFNGAPLPLDLTTEARIGNAVLWLSLVPDRAFVNWDMGNRNFVKIPRDSMVVLGIAAGNHTQACFDRSDELAKQVRAAADIGALAKIDLTAGWPGE